MSAPAPRRTWDGDAYHRVSTPMVEMALPVLDRLAVVDGESVIDAGCGTGRVTQYLVERNPHGRVIAVDADADMVRAARETLAGTGAVVEQVDLVALDVASLGLDLDAVDAIFSTATFHWIPDHGALFARLFAALVPGGRLEAQCGGTGNLASVKAAARAIGDAPEYRDDLEGVDAASNYASPEDTAARLAAVGFVDVRAWLEPNPVQPDDAVDYLSTINLGQHRQRLGEPRGERFVTAVAECLGHPGPVTVDYVRLNISARRPA